MKLFFSKLKYRTFTLVELLVVIVIIAILASVITASLGGARKQTRDTKRVSDVKNIAQALEQYYTDKGGYPYISNGTENTDAGLCIESSTTLQSMLIPSFLASIPVDPLYTASDCTSDLNTNCHCYIYRTQGATSKTKEYKLFSKTEAQVSTQQGVTSEGGTYYFETASPTETASSMTLSPQGSAYGNWFGYANTAPTFTRGSVAYKNDGTSVTSGTPRFEANGVTIEEGTSNILSGTAINPHGCSATAGTTYGSLSSVRYTVNNPGVQNNFGFKNDSTTIALSASPLAITISFWANVAVSPGAMGGYVRVHYTDGTETAHTWTYNNASWWNNIGSWQYVIGYATLTSGKTPQYIVNWYIYRDNATQGQMDIAGVQMEQKAYATSYIATTRNAESLTISKNGVLSDHGPWTVEFRGTPGAAKVLASQTRSTLFEIGTYYQANQTSLTVRFNWGYLHVQIYDNLAGGDLGTSYTANDLNSPIFLALRYDGTNLTVDTYATSGHYKTSGARSWTSPIDNAIRIGYYGWGGGELNGEIQDFRVSNVVRSDAEIATDAASSGDLPVDSSTTYKLGLNGSLN